MGHTMLATSNGVSSPPNLAHVAPSFIDVGHAQIAIRAVGQGPPILFVHGYPLSGLTWRHIVAPLAHRFTCHMVDLPGAGDTRWSAATDFRFGAQAETLQAVARSLGLERYTIVGHNTGGTIGRRLATLEKPRIDKLILIGTEIPNHRPPWIELFQTISNPRRPEILRFLLGRRWFRRQQ